MDCLRSLTVLTTLGCEIIESLYVKPPLGPSRVICNLLYNAMLVAPPHARKSWGGSSLVLSLLPPILVRGHLIFDLYGAEAVQEVEFPSGGVVSEIRLRLDKVHP